MLTYTVSSTTFDTLLVNPTDTFFYWLWNRTLAGLYGDIGAYTVWSSSFPPLILRIRLNLEIGRKSAFHIAGVKLGESVSTKEGQRSVTTLYQTCRVLLLRQKQSSLIIVTSVRAMASHHRLSRAGVGIVARSFRVDCLPSSSLPRTDPRVVILTIVPDQLNRHFPR